VGEAGYVGGYIDHYLWPLLYPAGLTREGRRGAGRGRPAETAPPSAGQQDADGGEHGWDRIGPK
jgi:hypothetical protein